MSNSVIVLKWIWGTLQPWNFKTKCCLWDRFHKLLEKHANNPDYQLFHSKIFDQQDIGSLCLQGVDFRFWWFWCAVGCFLTFYVFFLILVFIIFFIAVIIVADTFKSPMSKYIPNIEFILYNLYETIKDIILFFKNLF